MFNIDFAVHNLTVCKSFYVSIQSRVSWLHNFPSEYDELGEYAKKRRNIASFLGSLISLFCVDGRSTNKDFMILFLWKDFDLIKAFISFLMIYSWFPEKLIISLTIVFKKPTANINDASLTRHLETEINDPILSQQKAAAVEQRNILNTNSL